METRKFRCENLVAHEYIFPGQAKGNSLARCWKRNFTGMRPDSTGQKLH